MNIQVIGATINPKLDKQIKQSDISEPKSLDEFDVNFIDLSSQKLWKNKGESYLSIDNINDFKSIKTMLEKSSTSKVIIILPKNQSLYYHRYASSDKYYNSILLKDMLKNLKEQILSLIVPNSLNRYSLVYEITSTILNQESYTGDFYFEGFEKPITISDKSKKVTTITNGDRFYLTTLDVLKNQSSMQNYLEYLFPRKTSLPQWIRDYNFFNDEENKKLIEEKNSEIERAREIIEESNTILENNMKYKSILYTNGDELVTVVFDILEKILRYDFSSFVDEKKEDFLAKLENITFVGEIKGVTSNVKNEHISQLDVHYQRYCDKLIEENNKDEEVKALLIINPFRTKPIIERAEVHEIQVDLAIRNKSLIITTFTLLQVFEKYLKKELSNDRIIEVLQSKIGLLSIDDFFKQPSKNVDNSAYMI